MALFRTTEPAVEPITVAECKANLRIDHAAEDDLIEGLIRAARQEVELRTGTALIEQSWRLTFDCWPQDDVVLLARHPVGQIVSVTIYGSEGEAALLDPSRYQLDGFSRPARLHFDEKPRSGLAMNGVEIDFLAGFGATGVEVPDTLKRAMHLLVAHWYEFRARYGADSQPVSMPEGFDRLIAGYCRRRLN